MRTLKEQTKINWNEGNYKRTLNKEEKNIFKNLNREQKDTVIINYLNQEPIDLLQDNVQQKIDSITNKTFEERNERVSEKQNDKLINFFTTQGIYNPNQTTLNAFEKQNIMANFDKFYHALGSLTLNMDKQAMYNFYQTQQNQNFIQIAQNDSVLNQQEKIIEQNNEIIELLKTIAEK